MSVIELDETIGYLIDRDTGVSHANREMLQWNTTAAYITGAPFLELRNNSGCVGHIDAMSVYFSGPLTLRYSDEDMARSKTKSGLERLPAP